MNDPKVQEIKFARAVALAAARDICAALKPATTRLVVAGSLRRRKQSVGDVEILYIPATRIERDGMFDTKKVDLAEIAIAKLLSSGIIVQRPNINGHFTWGQKNKLARHVMTAVPVDLFAANEDNWWNLVVCRTGSKESNIAICRAAQARKLKWMPYGPGFETEGGFYIQTHSEQDVFSTVGIPYREPKDR